MNSINPSAGSLRDVAQEDFLSVVCDFLPTQDIASLRLASHQVQNNMIQGIADRFEETFGRNEELRNNISDVEQSDLMELMADVNLPHEELDVYSKYEPSKSWVERMIELAGGETELDRKIYGAYTRKIKLLQRCTPRSMVEFKHQMQAFFHENAKLNEYKRFKKTPKNCGLVNIISFFFFKYLYIYCFEVNDLTLQTSKTTSSECIQIGRYRFKPSIPPVQVSIEDLSKRRIPIGHFKIDDVDYEVSAGHTFSVDEFYKPRKNYSKRSLNGSIDTDIYFKGKGNPLRCCMKFRFERNHHLIQDDEKTNLQEWNWFCERQADWGRKMHQPTYKYLICRFESVFGTLYSEKSSSDQGTDRRLDQKIVQIAIELMIQNKKSILGIVAQVHNSNALMMLTAAGFKHNQSEEYTKRIQDFRATDTAGKLFPPYDEISRANYICSQFTAKDVDKKPVPLSKNSETLSDIIERDPVLYPRAALIPKYWIYKPNIDEGNDFCCDDDCERNM